MSIDEIMEIIERVIKRYRINNIPLKHSDLAKDIRKELEKANTIPERSKGGYEFL